jgi:molybdenum cofactor guanylyltransferase
MDNPVRASALILAGGASRRMGRDKAFIEFQSRPLIARVIERVQAVCTESFIIANDAERYAQFGLPIISDVYPGKGSLGGIYSGLLAAHEPYALVVACDMPFLNHDLMQYLISLAPQFDLVIPRAHDVSGRAPHSAETRRGRRAPRPGQVLAKQIDLHPMHAVYAKSCLEPIQKKLLADDLRTIGFHDAVRLRVVESDEIEQFDPQHLSFFNMNTPDDVQLAQALMKA